MTFRGIDDDPFATLLEVLERLAADVAAIKTELTALKQRQPNPRDPPQARELLPNRRRLRQ
jgi:primosomal protein N''